MSSFQKGIERRRKERVHLLYEVEDLGQIKQVELPYIVGVMADLSGQPEQELPPLRDRDFDEIDLKGFDKVLSGAAPHLAFTVKNRLTGEGNTSLPVDLHFRCYDDFAPDRVAEQIPAIKELLDRRRELKELLGKMPGKPKFRELLESILTDAERRRTLAGELGVNAPAGTETPPTEGPR
jgi:type VI secretion system protein ImpB